MDSLMTLLSVLIPMFAGFFIRVPKPYLPALDKVLSVLVYAVLLLIGVSLSRVEDLGSRLDDMALTVLWLFVCTVGANLLALAVLGKLFPWRIKGKGKGVSVGVSGSVGQLGCVLLGFAFGKLMRDIWMPSESAGMYCLMLRCSSSAYSSKAAAYRCGRFWSTAGVFGCRSGLCFHLFRAGCCLPHRQTVCRGRKVWRWLPASVGIPSRVWS